MQSRGRWATDVSSVTIFLIKKKKKSSVYYTFITHLSLRAKFHQKRNLYFIKFAVEKADSHTQVISNILKSFLITESNLVFYI